jgi:hypothetical protein
LKKNIIFVFAWVEKLLYIFPLANLSGTPYPYCERDMWKNGRGERLNRLSEILLTTAAVAQSVERVLGKDEVMGPIPISSYKNEPVGAACGKRRRKKFGLTRYKRDKTRKQY